jgi:dolichyl-phosphate-mannose-protein mannosyltransferase
VRLDARLIKESASFPLESLLMNDTTPMESGTSRWLIPIFLFVGTLLVIGATSKDYGITWDEPPYFHASDLHVRWISDFAENIASGQLRRSLDDQTIKAAWHWNPYNVPHPPFSRIISGGIKEISPHSIDKFSAYRMGPAIFFAVLVTVMFLWMKELFGTSTGLFSALAVVLTPNLFGYAHIAVTDLPLASMWFLTAYSFWKGLSSWKWSVVLGIVWGLTLATKFPAVLTLIPLILWAHLFHRYKYANNSFAMLFVGPIVMVATQPYLWHQTGLRVLEFLYEGISRGYRLETNFGVFFSNQLLSSNNLPWYYPFYLVGITMSEPIVVLALLGITSPVLSQERRSSVVLLLANAVFVLTLGLMPGAVLHDGVRQMLSALPFVVALASAGFFMLTTWLLNIARRSEALRQIINLESKLAGLLLLSCCLLSLLDLYFYHPFQLSYYNRFVGGLGGAYKRGLEVTYFMEAITPNFVQALNDNLPKNAAVYASFSNFIFNYYQKEGQLRRDIKISDGRQFDFYLLLNRRGALSPRERNLMEARVQPYLSIGVDGVPLVALFDFRNPRTIGSHADASTPGVLQKRE